MKKSFMRMCMALAGLALIVFISCCYGNLSNKALTQGLIKYDITYLENKLDNISTHVLPKQMKLYFNPHYSLTEIEGFMGLFSIKLISDYRKNTETTMVKFFDSKYVHYGNRNETSAIFQFMQFDNKTFTKDSVIIVGFPARQVTITEKGIKDTFNVYYTEAIGCNMPNRNNPYHDINGVLLRFVLQLSHMRMYLTANEVVAKEMPDSFFSVPDDYKEVSPENMAFLIEKMMSN